MTFYESWKRRWKPSVSTSSIPASSTTSFLLKDKLPAKRLLMVSDFGQNYTCHHHDQMQGTHWSRSEVTVHPIVAYYEREGKVVRHSFIFLSNDLKHDAHANTPNIVVNEMSFKSRDYNFAFICQQAQAVA